MAAMMRTSTLTVCSPPTGMNSRSWMTRSSLAWVGGVMVPISSRKIVPLSATSNRPRLLATAPVNAPRTWPNSVDSRRSVGTEPVLTTTNDRLGARRELVDGARQQLLAGAGLAGEQDVGARGRGAAHQLDHALHRPAQRHTSVPSPSRRWRRSRFSVRRRRCSSPLRTVSTTSWFLNGFAM